MYKKQKQEEPAEEKPKKPNIFKTFYEDQGMDGVIKLVKDSADAVGLMTVSYTHLDVYKRQKSQRETSAHV